MIKNRQEFNVGDKVINYCDETLKGKVVKVEYDEDFGFYVYLVRYGWKMKFKKLWTFGCDLKLLEQKKK